MGTLKGRNFLKLLDFTPAEINELLDLAANLKALKKAGVPHRMFDGKNRESVSIIRSGSRRSFLRMRREFRILF